MTRILLMEGERSIRNTLKERLEYEGYRVDVAESSAEAAQKIGANSYDMVLCSMQTLGFDPDSCLGKLKIGTNQKPVIVISPVKTIDTVVEIMKRGADDFIPKPIDLNKLLKVVRDLSDSLKAGTYVSPTGGYTNGQAQVNGQSNVQPNAPTADVAEMQAPKPRELRKDEIVGESQCMAKLRKTLHNNPLRKKFRLASGNDLETVRLRNSAFFRFSRSNKINPMQSY